jgi:heme oxygenase
MSVTADLRRARRMPGWLWAASQVHHDQVRRTPLVLALAARRLPWRAYADWLAQLYFLHESLAQVEGVMANEPHGWGAARSARVSLPALAADLRFLHGQRWEQQIVAYPATTVYCTHLRDIAVREVRGFVAHHYTRHIEDLRAVQELAPAVAVAYGLDHAGRRFLMPDDTDLWRHRDGYHRLLDATPWSAMESDGLVADASQVHRMYLGILNELGRSWT